MICFEQNVNEVGGLTSFKLNRLPAWMKQRVLSSSGTAANELMTDSEVVDTFVRDEWLGHWGAATIGGREVFVLEHLDVNCKGVVEAAELAHRLQCGFLVVEMNDDYEGGCTTYLTEDYCFAARNRSANARHASA
jgi:hypothetical protein